MSQRVIEDGIRYLIGDHGKVVIPSIGVFIGRYVSARFDPVEGTVAPPTLHIQLKEDKGENPTLLIEYLSEQLGCTYREAEEKIVDYGQMLSDQLGRKEIITLEGMGRLYKGIQDDLKFVQDNGNRLFQSFGLPILEFQPISRIENRLLTLAKKDAPIKKRVKTAARIKAKLLSSEFIPITVGVGAFLMILGLFLFVPKPQVNFAKEMSNKRAKPERINTKPSHEPFVELTTAELSPEEILAEEAKLESEVEAVVNGAAEKPSVDNSQAIVLKQSIIIVGVYGQTEGILMRKSQIERLGHTFYSDPKGDLTRVGLIVHHQNDQELVEVLRIVQQEITKKAWIL